MALLAVACRPAVEQTPPAATPAPTPRLEARPTDEARVDPGQDTAIDIALVDAGQPPRRELRYELVPGTAGEFLVEHRLTLFDDARELGSLEVRAPLVIEVTAQPAGYALTLRLGPARITRRGESDGIRWGRGAEAAHRPLLARANLTPGGNLKDARIETDSIEALVLLYETLLDLDVPPNRAVGAGARWRTRRQQAGGAWTTTEYELVQNLPNRATFRVQRQQGDRGSSNGVRAAGEWTFTRDAWPPTGHDQVTAAVPESGPGARFSVRFSVTKRP